MPERGSSLRFIVTPIELIEMVERGDISAEIHTAYERLLGLSYEQTGSSQYPFADITYGELAALWRMKPRGARERVDDMERAGLVKTARQGRNQVRITFLVKYAGGPRHEERPSPNGNYAPVGSGGINSSAGSARSAAPASPEPGGESVLWPPKNGAERPGHGPDPTGYTAHSGTVEPPPVNLPPAAAVSGQSAAGSGTVRASNVVVDEREEDNARVRAPEPRSKSDVEWLRKRRAERVEKFQDYGVIAAYQLEQEIERAIAEGRIDEWTISTSRIAKEWWAIKNSLQTTQQHMAPGLLVANVRAIIAGVHQAGGEGREVRTDTDDGRRTTDDGR